MEIGEELLTWLKDKKKAYTARLEFAIKVWQSVDFVYINKYEVICKWLSESLAKEKTNNGELPTEQLQQLFALRAQPGLVNVATKSQLIKTLVKRIENAANVEQKNHAQLLQNMLNFELLQDALRADYELLMSCYGQVFSCYEQQLLSVTAQRHAEFVLPLLQQLQEYVQRAQQQQRLLKAYNDKALQPLCELTLQLREHGLCCFEQLAALEQQLTRDLNITEVKQRITEQPALQVQLLLLETSLYNERLNAKNLHILLTFAFEGKQLELPIQALATLKKHKINLELEKSEDVVVRLYKLVKVNKAQHLQQVLMLMCAALRLNPLLLEPHVYQITIWLLTTQKCNATELRLYGDYLVLLLDMCRRLRRTERFVLQLLKALREWLSSYALELKQTKELQILEEPDKYLKIIFKTFEPQSSLPTDRLAQTWPNLTAGLAFTRLCSQLQSKPSMVIWKMLLHTFTDILETEKKSILPQNLNFAIELQLTLLNQYLVGSHLAATVQQHAQPLQLLRQQTAQLLQQFAQHLLQREHKRSTMNAFLQCLDNFTNFEQLLFYYWPAGLERDSLDLQLPYKFLSTDDWNLIKQRVHNFGKAECRQRLQRLELQSLQTHYLQHAEFNCPAALLTALPAQLLRQLQRQQKEQLLQQHENSLALQNSHLQLLHDADCVELLLLQLLQNFAALKIKHTLLPKQLEIQTDAVNLALTLRQQCSNSKQITLPLADTSLLIASLQQLPLSQLVCSIKLPIWLLLLTLYFDVRRGQLTELANQLLEQLIDLLHFGQPLPICSHFPQLGELLQLIPLEESDVSNGSVCWRFYEMFFSRCIRRLMPGSELFLASCAEFFREQLEQKPRTLQLVESRLLLLAIETLSGATGAQARRMQRHLQPLLEIYGQFVASKFRSMKKTPVDAAEFVQNTLSGYPVYLSSCINRAAKMQREEFEQKNSEETEKDPKESEKSEKKKKRKLEQQENVEPEENSREKKKKRKEKENQEQNSEPEPEQNQQDSSEQSSINSTPIDENLRRICKIYIGHSLNYRNVHAIKLLNVALTHREQLHLDQDEIEFLLDSYWRQLNADIEAATLDIQSIEPAIKLIIGYKTNEDFLLLLRRLSTQLEGMRRPETEAQHTSLQNVLILLQLFSKCSLSSIKGAMLNEHFELLIGNVSLRLPEAGDATYRKHVLRLLEAQRALASNRTVPLTGETLDSIIGTMLDINMKKFISAGGTLDDFVVLHGGISENLLLLLRQHGALMSDRAAQLTALCQDLIESIVCYRSDRKQAQNLNEQELDALADLSLKLVTLLAAIAAGPQALAVKRVAPFLLIFTIKQMVTTERPTTLFEKIKVNLDRVCHELISLCDHRAGHFILRSSNEAGARMYQNLVKEHDKYHKFRGKV